MNRLIALAVAALSTFAFAGSTWNIDTSHARAEFSVKHMGLSQVRGSLGAITGKWEMTDDKDVTKSMVEATIDLTAINTGTEKRDGHLKSPDFFDVAKNPTLTFKSTKIEKVSDTKLKVIGNLTIKGTTKEVTLDADVGPAVDHPAMPGAMARAVSATTTLNRHDFKLDWQMPKMAEDMVVGKDVKVTIDLEVIKPAPAKKS